MSHAIPDAPWDTLGAVEKASTALARVEVAGEPGGKALAEALIRRKAVSLIGGGEKTLRMLVLGDDSAAGRVARHLEKVLAEPRDRQMDATELLDALGPDAPIQGARDALLQALAIDHHHPALARAAIAYGCIAATPPATRESLAVASMLSDMILSSSGLTIRSRLSPTQLDASTRSAAVQVERSGAWVEWIRVWCLSLAREAGTVERAVRGVLTELAAQRSVARQQHRIGATDEVVLAQLQSVSAFTIREAATTLGLTAPTVGTAIERLEREGVATELTGQKRDRIWTSTTLLRLSISG